MANQLSFGFQLIPTQRQDIEFLPFSRMERYMEKTFNLPSSENDRNEIVRAIKYFEYSLRTDDALRNHKELWRKIFVNAYCSLNFVCPEIGILHETKETRAKFLLTMSQDPYLMQDKNERPVALDIYHKKPEEGLEHELYSDSFVSVENLSPLSTAGPEAAYGHSSALERKIIKSAKEAIARLRSFDNRYSIEVQLRALIAGIINPLMFGINLEEKDRGLSGIPELYREAVERNGDFEMPMPKCMV